MKTLGKEVLMLAVGPNNPRNGEGDFIRLKNGDIMFAYAEYTGDSWEDHVDAHISAVFSSDEGESFHGKRMLFPKEPHAANNMCVSLIRLNNGDIGLFYLRVIENEKRITLSEIILRRSSDEGATWSEPQVCISQNKYFVMENDRLVRLKSGRLLLPLNLHITGENLQIEGRGRTVYFYSDDDGETWADTNNCIEHPHKEPSFGLQETGVIQFESGRLFSFSRTGSGTQFESFSDDEGMTWTTPRPSSIFFSPPSPMTMEHITDKYTVALYNPIPNYPGKPKVEMSGRTPVLCLVSDGDGSKIWSEHRAYYLEDDLTNGYCYYSIFVGENYFLVSYYHSNNSKVCLTACKIKKIMISEIESYSS